MVSESLVEHEDPMDQIPQHKNTQAEEESDEAATVLGANTVVHPWAMMVPALDAGVTQVAVLRARCRQYLAPGADIIWVKLIQQVHYF